MLSEDSSYLSCAGRLHGCCAFLWSWTIANFPLRQVTGQNILKYFSVLENNSAFFLEKFLTDFLLGRFKVGNICLMTILLHLLITLQDRLSSIGLNHVCFSNTFFFIFRQPCFSFLSVNFWISWETRTENILTINFGFHVGDWRVKK